MPPGWMTVSVFPSLETCALSTVISPPRLCVRKGILSGARPIGAVPVWVSYVDFRGDLLAGRANPSSSVLGCILLNLLLICRLSEWHSGSRSLFPVTYFWFRKHFYIRKR